MKCSKSVRKRKFWNRETKIFRITKTPMKLTNYAKKIRIRPNKCKFSNNKTIL